MPSDELVACVQFVQISGTKVQCTFNSGHHGLVTLKGATVNWERTATKGTFNSDGLITWKSGSTWAKQGKRNVF